MNHVQQLKEALRHLGVCGVDVVDICLLIEVVEAAENVRLYNREDDKDRLRRALVMAYEEVK